GPDDEVGYAVGVDVGGSDGHAPAEAGGEGEEGGQQGTVGDGAVGQDLAQFRGVDDLDVRAGARPGPDDEVRSAAGVDVGGSDGHAPAEAGGEGEEAGQEAAVLALEDLDVRAGAGPGAHDDVRHSVAVDVADRHGGRAREARERRELTQQMEVDVVDF